VVEVTDLVHQHVERFTILGAWDFDSDTGNISYLSPVGQTLIGHAAGEEVELVFEGTQRRYRIEKITAYKAPAPTQA
jgi:transcription elongation GreA/GreB family factor